MSTSRIPIETLHYDIRHVLFWIETDGSLRVWYSLDEADAERLGIDEFCHTFAGDVAFALMTLFSMSGVRTLINREELIRQRVGGQESLKATRS
jgi:hypothetical protein